jgi:periplasmic mercuric ion binding protein
MKTLFASLFALMMLALAPLSSSAAVITDTISVTSMQCGMCESRIEKALKKADFINDVEADVENSVVVVSYDNTKATHAQIVKLITMTGYDTAELAADAEAQGNLHGCCKPGAHKEEPTTAPKKQVKKATSEH